MPCDVQKKKKFKFNNIILLHLFIIQLINYQYFLNLVETNMLGFVYLHIRKLLLLPIFKNEK